MHSADSNDLHYALDPQYASNDEGAYYISCDTVTELSFEIQGMQFSISTSDYIGPPDNSFGEGLCLSNIKGNDSVVDEGWWEVGTGFLRNVYPRVC
jgi:Eukaryotic aspartyl protease